MTIDVALFHQTRYRYDRRIKMGPQVVRLRPAPHARTPIRSYSFRVDPEPHFLNWQQDPFGNFLARLIFPEKVDHFTVTVDLRASMVAINPFDFFLAEEAETYPFEYSKEDLSDLAPYLEAGGEGEEFEAFLATISRQKRRTVDFFVDVNQAVRAEIDYLVRMEPGVQTPAETLLRGAGSCRDSAWLLVHLYRRLGIAARFCSGYLIQLKADEKPVVGPAGAAEDFTDLHAWCEVYAPGAGWIGLDPTSGLLAGEGHIPLAATPQPSAAAPITGGLEPCEVEFEHEMRIERVFEPPRATRPYTRAQWRGIDALGETVDRVLVEEDVRLTTGGEPTFVADEDFDAPEWTIEALGPTKAQRADRLIRRLQQDMAPHGALMHGQGKWYPGEPLPRWALSLYGRTDGDPLWRDPNLIAGPDAEDRSLHAQDQEAAGRFGAALAEALEVEPNHLLPLYEDAVQIRAAIEAMPPNVDPAFFDNEAAMAAGMDDNERRGRLRIAKALARGLDRPAAFVLPVQPWGGEARRRRRRFRWRSEYWRSRAGQLRLHVGDSPAGLRLPLGSVETADPGSWIDPPLDPFAPREPLPPTTPIRTQRDREPIPSLPPAGVDVPMDRAARGAVGFVGGLFVRTALALEVRDGILNVFLPPVGDAAAFVDLLDAIEECAADLGQPLRLEGYPPPPDPRLFELKATPDPGVIEVNVQPARSWDEQKRITTTLYEAARQTGLTARRYGLDGRPLGSGGGAHVVLGGPSAPDSPFLRRPDLLASMVRFWQRHPAMSYVFSGAFIGPTSQAPRVDEARDDLLDELEIATAQLPPRWAPAQPPWLVDRIFRNLLTDLTGNTHRAEICIDKLYSPDGPTGRLGLVELRAFEMPPHAEMALVQNLLVRALIAWFWREPYKEPFRRHGGDLHDRFMLRADLERDLSEALDELAGAGFVFDRAWLQPHLDFRFPLLGATVIEGVEFELRAALEPWPVLGEEGTSTGVARFVDSSLERVEITVRGALGPDRTLTCNGVEMPLRVFGEDERGRPVQIGGVRYRAWLPASCLHPTIWAHAPLTFDLVDRREGRSLGGFRKHVAHPGGRNVDVSPVNALEAEGRRIALFEPMGHSPGPVVVRAAPHDPRRPACLDLRRC